MTDNFARMIAFLSCSYIAAVQKSYRLFAICLAAAAVNGVLALLEAKP